LFVEKGLKPDLEERVEDLFLVLVEGEIMLMKTVFEKSIFGINGVAVLTDTDEEVDFFAGFLTGIPGEVFRKFVSIDHDGGLLNRASPEKHVEDLTGASREGFLANGFTPMINELALRTEDNDRGVLLKRF